ncbi:hypothetical protein DB31_0336 [Hyalangium minutum]|uniref:Uncharacterized protein n=1 Tax=Hyalangium minutum TaxID=394096 RepID=A0A085WWL2_9BACT|nr:hypothetical protein DB31_0336 [Hyalangium minutum]
MTPPSEEQPAPPDRFVLTTRDGQRFTGADARIDIRFTERTAPADVELSFTTSDAAGGTWAALARPPVDFLRLRSLGVPIATGALGPGQAAVERRSAEGTSTLADSGELQLKLEDNKLVGEFSRTPAGFEARFAGPFVVTCSVPQSAGGPNPPSPEGGGSLVLVVDTNFETELCRPFAALAGQ